MTSVYSEREESFTHGLVITGDLNFSVDYDDKTSSLRIYVKQAREVAVADKKTNSSSTYVFYSFPYTSHAAIVVG